MDGGELCHTGLCGVWSEREYCDTKQSPDRSRFSRDVGGASHPSCTGSAYAEAIQVGLNTTILPGSSIDIAFSVQVDGQGTATTGPNSCVNFGVYLYHSSSPPAANGWCCFNVTPQFAVVGGVIQQGTYTTFTSTIVAAGTYNRMLIGPFCNANTTSGGCSNYTATRMYFNLDDVVVQPSTVLEDAPLWVNGNAFLEFNVLDWEVGEADPYTRFFVERSTDGTIFNRIGEAQRNHPEQVNFEYRDEGPASGTTFYRLTAEAPGGNWVHSNVIELLSGVQASRAATQFTYGYDRNQEVLKIHPGTDEEQNLSLVIRDMSGKEVHRTHWQTENGKWIYEVPVGHLTKGLYVLELAGNQGNITGFNKWMKY